MGGIGGGPVSGQRASGVAGRGQQLGAQDGPPWGASGAQASDWVGTLFTRVCWENEAAMTGPSQWSPLFLQGLG